MPDLKRCVLKKLNELHFMTFNQNKVSGCLKLKKKTAKHISGSLKDISLFQNKLLAAKIV